MKKIVIAIAAALSFVSPAIAQTATPSAAPATPTTGQIDPKTIDCQNIDIAKYNSTQIESIRSLCNQAQVQAEQITPQDVREWASLGKEFSVAVTETARGLGVTVNEFLVTPAGILIAMYFMWDIIGGIIIGIPLLFGIWWLYFKVVNIYVYKESEYAYVPVLFGLFNRKKIVKHNIDKPTDALLTMILVAIPAVILTMMDIGILIF